jgi:fructose-specific phosphotransferase system IIC component
MEAAGTGIEQLPRQIEGMGPMRTVVVTVLGLIGGFLAGIVVSEIIGIIGFLLFDSVIGFRFLPVISALVAGVAAVVINRRARRTGPPASKP